MNMTVTLYNYQGDKRVVDKVLGQGTDVSCKPNQNVSRMNPVITIGYNSAYVNCNYVYIDTFNRYYYVNDVSVDIGKAITLSCSIDVLKSYATYIKNSNATVVRSEKEDSIVKTSIPDDKYPLSPNEYNVTVLTFTSDPMAQTGDNSYVIGVN